MGKIQIKPIEEFLTRVTDQYGPEHIILFGSRARGHARRDSDFDLIIVSRAFEGVHLHDRAVSMYGLVGDSNAFFDFICLTPVEYKKARSNRWSGVVYVGAREGKDLMRMLKPRAA